MSLEYDHCLKKGKIKHFSRGKTLAPKELEAAAADLERAKKTYSDGDYKWTTIQLYYSMFHSARALLYFKNLREHSHFCLIAAMKCLYVDTQQISLSLVEGLQHAKDLREDADYYNRWSHEGSEKLLEVATAFLEAAKKIIDVNAH